MRFLFVDRILQLSPGKFIQGIKHITRDDTYLSFDEENKVCFMPSLIGETLGQLAAWNVMVSKDFTMRPVAGIASSACLKRSAYIGETLLLESFIDVLDDVIVQYHSVARIAGEIVFTIEGALGPLLPMEDFIEPSTARQQFAEINRPGEWMPSAIAPYSYDSALAEGAIPAAPMRFDRILESDPGVRLCAEKCVSRAASYFSDHFPNKPVLPMTVLLECKLNLAKEFILIAGYKESYRVVEVRKIKINEFILPGDVIVCFLSLKQKDAEKLILSYRSEVDGKRVCVLEVVMAVKGVQ